MSVPKAPPVLTVPETYTTPPTSSARLGRTASELAEHLATKTELLKLLTVAIEQLDAEGAREAFLTRLKLSR